MGGSHNVKPALRNTITVKGDTVEVVIAGPQPKALADEMLDRFIRAVGQARLHYDKVFVRVNLHGLKPEDVSVDARLSMKEAFRQPFYRLAAVGDNRLLEVAMYLMRAGNAAKRARYFTSDHAADVWLKGESSGRRQFGGPLFVILTLVGLTGVLALLGWATGNQLLTRVVPDLRPINPLAAIGLIALALAFVADWYHMKRLLWTACSLMLVLGTLALLPLHVDRWLFSAELAAAGGQTDFADSAALSFILSALCLLLNSRSLRARWLSLGLSGAIVALAFVNVFGLLYAKEAVYSWSPQFVMALQLAVAFIFMGGTLVYMSWRDNHSKSLPRIGTVSWLVVLALLGVQVATYAGWRQSLARNHGDSLQAFSSDLADVDRAVDERIRTYIDALHGFKALFASTDTVQQGDFETYYQASGTAKDYPGLRALSYISRVDEAGLPRFITDRRADRSLIPQGNPGFTVRQKADKPVHYVVAYVAGTPTSASIGNDLAGDGARSRAFETASATGEPTSSGTIQFQASATSPAGRGFFITMPVKQKTAQQASGYVNAVFTYDGLFGAVLSGLPENALGLRISDAGDGTSIYANRLWPDYENSQNGLRAGSDVQVADRLWRIEAVAPASYALSRNQTNLPRTILIAGQALSILLALLFLMLGRSRSRALALADTITLDLQKERNRAVGLQQKDEAILSSIGDAVFAIGTDGKISLFNPAAEQISGYRVDEAIGQPYRDVLQFVYEQDGQPNTEFVDRAMSGQIASMKNHTYLVRKDGSHVPVADSAAPIHDASGEIIGVIVVFRDATAERALSTERSQLQAILSSLPVGVFVAEAPAGRPLLTNAKAQELLGRTIDKQAGLGEYAKTYELTRPDGKPYPEDELPLAQTLREGRPAVKDDIMVRFASGKQIAMRATSAPILDESGVMRRAVVVSEDITKEHELDKAKTEFVSLASHQLRTPLSAINWYAELLLDAASGKLTKQQREYAREIYEGNQRMVELVDSLLDVSRLELGKLNNRPESVELGTLAEALIKELQPTIKHKKLTLVRQIARDIPTVNADPKLLRMVVQNLLSNAVKYTPAKGKVNLTLATALPKAVKAAGLPAGDYVCLTINDTGYGIPKAQQDKIFSKMFRADNVQALDVEGTGLGLYIVKQVLDRLGGAIRFESIESVGTTFYVLLPDGKHATIKPNHEEKS